MSHHLFHEFNSRVVLPAIALSFSFYRHLLERLGIRTQTDIESALGLLAHVDGL